MSTFKGFDSVELRSPKSSNFDMSHERRVTTRMGKLTPIMIKETLPGDYWKLDSEVMLRLAPLLAPIMHRVNVYVHGFFVANRTLWQDWELFITGGRLGTETPPVPPYFDMEQALDQSLGVFELSTLSDYLGIPEIPDADIALWAGRTLDAMPYLAYQKVWNDYYRDQNYEADLEGKQDLSTAYLPAPSGNQTNYGLMFIRNRKWEHDYFTSALLFTQRGDEVTLPVSVEVNQARRVLDDALSANGAWTIGSPGLEGSNIFDSGSFETKIVGEGVSVTINELRVANALQRWLERNALAGSRYSESLKAHWDVNSSDGRLQRAVYLGGSKVAVKVSEVLTTAFSKDDADVTVPPANMSGHGLTFGNTKGMSYRCEEHGFILLIMSIMPTSAYMQGIPRMFLHRNTYLDYPFPEFAHLGEQEVFDDEIYADPTSVPANRTNPPVFGYQSRYVDWKWEPSGAHGDFRASLDFWHLTRKFSSQPNLSAAFVTFEDELQDRVFAVSGVDTLWCYIYNNVSVQRKLPYFGTPML